MKTLRGTALYCGIGVDLKTMEHHLGEAADAGINAVFTSLQLPESNKAELLENFGKMADIAHHYGMLVDADLSANTAKMFDVDMFDLASLRRMGLDIARLDWDQSPEKTAELTNNPLGMIIEINAAQATEKRVSALAAAGLNPEQTHFCHNYYPMRYTGLKPEQAAELNANIHAGGYRVGGFIASQTHQRIACSNGLPTVERHRFMNVFTATQEAMVLGFDDIFFGDDLADKSELSVLAAAAPGIATFRMTPYVQDKVMDWLLGRPLKQMGYGLDMILRSAFNNPNSIYPGKCDHFESRARHRGDVCICKSPLLRYAGEIQIARQDLPMDENIAVIGHVIDDDLPLLEVFMTPGKFMLIEK